MSAACAETPRVSNDTNLTHLTKDTTSNTHQISHHSIESEHSTSESHRVCQYVASTRYTVCRDDDEFNSAFHDAQTAIIAGIYPELIPEGSSGSYFVKDISGKILAVFKPRDEEPFAELNPKWPKFFQRILCFCCFGRACLIPNSGYLSETGASIVDSWMELEIVPKTRVVKLASPTFYYSRCCGRAEIKPKEGSFQLFVEGYESAPTVFARWDYDKNLLTPREEKRFIILFQRLCVLDYVIRNTDRHLGNLLIRHIPNKELEIAAIDNGLAFPVKHPECTSRFRTFRFPWANLKWAKEPWDEQFRSKLLSQLTPGFVYAMCKELQVLFRHPHSSNRLLVYNQIRVVRGQLFNLRMALLNNDTPAQMAAREPQLLSKKFRRNVPNSEDWLDWYNIRSVDYSNRNCC